MLGEPFDLIQPRLQHLVPVQLVDPSSRPYTLGWETPRRAHPPRHSRMLVPIERLLEVRLLVIIDVLCGPLWLLRTSSP